MTVQTMKLEEFHGAMKAQGVPINKVLFRCPRCETPQCADDLIDAGAGENIDEVEKYLGFSCVGRWNKEKGCDWTLGGLFRIHKLEVETEDGQRHPRFMPLTPEEAEGVQA